VSNLADHVLKEVIKKINLSDELLGFLYTLLAREEQKGYESFYIKPRGITQEYVDVYAYTIIHILSDLPTHRSSKDGLRVQVHELKGWGCEGLDVLLPIPVEFQPSIEELTPSQKREWGKDYLTHPSKFSLKSYSRLFQELVNFFLSIKFSPDSRKKHTQIIGGTGAGKTVLLQQLIAEDIKSGASVIVMDSSLDLINTLKYSSIIPPERLRIIDPRDSVEYPLSLNMFDIGYEELSKLDPVAYQSEMTNVIGLLTFMFSSIMGEELSGHQAGFLRFCCSLMLRVPGATVLTFIDLLENGTDEYQQYIDEMSDVAQSFFRTGFPAVGNRKLKDELAVTRRSIHRRLLWLLDNDTFRSFFTSPRNKFDISEVMNNGQVLLINTDEILLGKDGRAFFGRYLISLLDQASLKRTLMPKAKRTPVYVYIDEAGDYFEHESKMLTSLMYKGRKSNVGLTLTHHDTEQLDSRVYKSIRGSANIRIVGSPDPGEIYSLKKELKVDFIPETPGAFAVYVKGDPSGFIARSRLGVIEEGGRRSEEEMQNIIMENRARYCVDGDILEKTPGIPVKVVKSGETKGIPEDPLAPYT